ncbi:MAG: class I tRNA ligase family protein, partial [Nitrospirota bacterium]|nr:class I tRNA ligase family protein [Nitrospirota bacterium]
TEVKRSLEEYRFNDSANILYQFIWHELCDWYVEMIKPELYGDNNQSKSAALSTLVHVYEVSLGLLHPFMPFITEEIWQQLPGARTAESLCVRKYPTAADGMEDRAAEEKMGVVMDAVAGVRSIRGELNISPSLELKTLIRPFDGAEDILTENVQYISKLARARDIEIGKDLPSPGKAAAAVRSTMEIYVPLEGLIDIDAEIIRLTKDLNKTDENLAFVKRKLHNKEFMSKAPKAVIEENRVKYNEYLEKLRSIQENVDKLKAWGKAGK